jgi:hypothetical protein
VEQLVSGGRLVDIGGDALRHARFCNGRERRVTGRILYPGERNSV